MNKIIIKSIEQSDINTLEALYYTKEIENFSEIKNDHHRVRLDHLSKLYWACYFFDGRLLF